MKRLLYIILIVPFLVSALNVNSQNFEGVIYSTTTYTSKIDTLSADEIFGQSESSEKMYIKDGFYKVNSSTDFMSLMLWRHIDTALYFFNKESEDTLWYDKTYSHPSGIQEYNIIKNVDTILGYPCDALIILDDKFKTITYYFSPELSLDPEFYKHCQNSSIYEVLKLIQSIKLRLVIESHYAIIDSRVQKVIRKKLPKNIFELPKHSFLLKAEY